MNKYVADFETTTDPNDCRVWAAAITQIGTDHVEVFNSLETFLDYLQDGWTVYFHNLKFDGEFLLNHFYNNGYTHVEKSKNEKLACGELSTLISETNVWYTMSVGLKNGTVKIVDSLKILPMSVDQVAKGFGLPLSKLKIDYKKYRGVGYQLNEIEKEYIKHDVLIISKALEVLFREGLTQITAGSNAFHDFKHIFGGRRFQAEISTA